MDRDKQGAHVVGKSCPLAGQQGARPARRLAFRRVTDYTVTLSQGPFRSVQLHMFPWFHFLLRFSAIPGIPRIIVAQHCSPCQSFLAVPWPRELALRFQQAEFPGGLLVQVQLPGLRFRFSRSELGPRNHLANRVPRQQ